MSLLHFNDSQVPKVLAAALQHLPSRRNLPRAEPAIRRPVGELPAGAEVDSLTCFWSTTGFDIFDIFDSLGFAFTSVVDVRTWGSKIWQPGASCSLLHQVATSPARKPTSHTSGAIGSALRTPFCLARNDERTELHIVNAVTHFAHAMSVPNRRWPSGDAVIGDRFCHGNVMNWWEEGRWHEVSFNPTTLSSAACQRLLTADSCVAFRKNHLRCQFEFRGPCRKHGGTTYSSNPTAYGWVCCPGRQTFIDPKWARSSAGFYSRKPIPGLERFVLLWMAQAMLRFFATAKDVASLSLLVRRADLHTQQLLFGQPLVVGMQSISVFSIGSQTAKLLNYRAIQ